MASVFHHSSMLVWFALIGAMAGGESTIRVDDKPISAPVGLRRKQRFSQIAMAAAVDAFDHARFSKITRGPRAGQAGGVADGLAQERDDREHLLFTSLVGQANYTAAKAGVLAFTRTPAKELAAMNIRV